MRRIALIAAALAWLLGCTPERVSVPAELQGVYETSRAGYEDCVLQIGPETIAWKDAEGGVRSHRVVGVVTPEQSGDGEWTLRHDLGGDRADFTFTLFGGQIKPVNQRQLVWHKRSRS